MEKQEISFNRWKKNVFLDFLWFMCVKLSEIDSVLAENDFIINYVVASQ